MIKNSFVFKNKLFYFEHLFEKDEVMSDIKKEFSIFRKSGKRLDRVDEDKLHKRLKPRFDDGCVFMYQLI